MGESHDPGSSEDPSARAGPDRHGAARPPPGSVPTVAATEGDRDAAAEVRDADPVGARIDRYVVLGRLGAGGMGVVYAAWDTALERKVAIKVLRPKRRAPGAGGRAQARLLREAQALAQLSSPYVVSVFDVGRLDERVYIAMEYVEGSTLRARIEGGPISYHTLLSWMLPAAKGLSAIHGVGLLHRDFKPDNVMIGADGRVRVMDLGLARVAEVQPPALEAAGSLPVGRTGALSVDLTRAGALVGTPAYMAPEQFTGGELSPATDQFAFCVTMYEALYGQRPFAGDTPAQIAFAVCQGRVRAPPRGIRVPRWLHRVVERGLAVEPADRFADMEALVAAVEAGRRQGRRRRWLGVAVAAAALGGGLLGGAQFQRHRAREACVADAGALDDVWSPSAAAAVSRAFSATGLPYAPSTAERLSGVLARYVRDWEAARARVCTAVVAGPGVASDAADRAKACLADRRRALAALVDSLQAVGARDVPHAVMAAVALPDPAACTNASWLARVAGGFEPSAEGDELRRRLSRAEALHRLGRYEAAQAEAEAVVAEATEHGPASLETEGRLVLGRVLEARGEFEPARAAYDRAFVDALRRRFDDAARRAAVSLAGLHGLRLARFDDGHFFLGTARSLLDRIGADERSAESGRMLEIEGGILYKQGRNEAAEAALDRAYAVLTAVYGPDDPRLANVLNSRAAVAHAAGAYDRAERDLAAVLRLRTRALGEDHPLTASAYNNLGVVALDAGAPARAVRYLSRTLELRMATVGEDHIDVARARTNLANAQRLAGRPEEAARLLDEALAIHERVFGPDHPDVATVLVSRGSAQEDLGDWAGARASYERALAIRRAVFGDDHRTLASAELGLARVSLARGAGAAAARFAGAAVRHCTGAGASEGRCTDAIGWYAVSVARWAAAPAEDRARAAEMARRAYERLGQANPDEKRLAAAIAAAYPAVVPSPQRRAVAAGVGAGAADGTGGATTEPSRPRGP